MNNNKEHIKLEDLDKKSMKSNFQIPEGYFDSLKDRVEMKKPDSTKSALSELKKKISFDIPANYHSDLKTKLAAQLIENNKGSKKSKLRVLYYSIGAIAAVFIGLIVFNLPSENSKLVSENKSSVSVTVGEFQNSVIEEVENYDPLLAMLSDEENESEYDYLFTLNEKEETTVEDIQDLFIDEWEEDADFIY